MGIIKFTQYVLPHGKMKEITVEMSEEISTLAQKLVEKGARFEIEVLSTGHIHMDCSFPSDDGPLSTKLCPNGPGVRLAVEELVKDACSRARIK